jgi:hypothetical protein
MMLSRLWVGRRLPEACGWVGSEIERGAVGVRFDVVGS